MLRRLHPYCRLLCIALFGILMGALASGCMWGVVRDADTGKPLAGVTITLTDTQGQTLTTTSDANGLFGFGAPVSVAPARGPVNFQVSSPGYQSITETRDVLYDDNPNASFQNMQSFWEVQIFNLARTPVLYHSAEGDFSIMLPGGWGIIDNYFGAGSVLCVSPPDYQIFPADAAVGVAARPAGETLDDWVNGTEDGMRNVTDNLQLLEKSTTAVNGVTAIRVIVTYTVTPDSEVPGLYVTGQQLQEMAYFLKKGNKGYILDFTATQANFSALQSRFERIAESFKLD